MEESLIKSAHDSLLFPLRIAFLTSLNKVRDAARQGTQPGEQRYRFLSIIYWETGRNFQFVTLPRSRIQYQGLISLEEDMRRGEKEWS